MALVNSGSRRSAEFDSRRAQLEVSRPGDQSASCD